MNGLYISGLYATIMKYAFESISNRAIYKAPEVACSLIALFQGDLSKLVERPVAFAAIQSFLFNFQQSSQCQLERH